MTEQSDRNFRKWLRLLFPVIILAVVAVISNLSNEGARKINGDISAKEFDEPVWLTVVDGDTLRYEGRKLRLLGVDTPEPSRYGNAECPEEAKLGDEATDFVKSLVSAQKVTVVWSGRQDKYGRHLVNVMVDGNKLGDILMEEGLAEPWRGQQADWCSILRARN